MFRLPRLSILGIRVFTIFNLGQLFSLAWQLDLIRNDATRDQVGKYNLPITNFLKVKNEAGQGIYFFYSF